MRAKSSKQIASFRNTSALTRPLIALGAASVLFGSGSAKALDPNTLPQDPTVTGGKDTFSQSGNTLTVNQSTNRTIIDWRSFNIGSNAQTNFVQPNSGSIAVNRINGSTNPTDIEGGLHANGQVWILNPNGVFFGKNARVDAAGIVASTANINDKAFMAGSNKLQMTGADHGSIVNQGNISVGASGLAAFVAPSVRNSGTITATVGKVTLAAGSTYTLDLAGDHLVELGLGSVRAVVDNSGKIVNPGGTITLTAKAASQVVDSVVNVSGIVSASSATKSGGTIILGGDDITTTKTAQITADAGTNGTGGTISSDANKNGNYAGTFSAKGGSASGDGGKVDTSGANVTVAGGTRVNTLAAHGKTGTWTIDPNTLTVVSGSGTTSSTIGADTVVANMNTTGEILSANTTINVNATIDSSAQTNSNVLEFEDANHDGILTVNLNADILLGSHQSILGQASTVNLISGGSIATGLDVLAASGGKLNLAAGTYALSGELDIDKSVNITGAGAANTTITSNSTGYGIFVDADNVSLNKFTFDASGITGNSTYGIKVSPDTSNPSDRLQNFSISNVTIDGSYKTGLDLNGVLNATINFVTVENTIWGDGINLTDSANITVKNTTTSNNTWGGLAISQANRYYNQQTTNITVASSNNFEEANPIFAEDESSTNDFGTLNISGYSYIVQSPTNPNDVYTWFQKTEQNAIDFAAAVNATTAYVEGYGSGVTGNNIFYVGTSTGDTALSINAATTAATDGATVNVLAGTYEGQVIISGKNLTLTGAGAGNTTIEASDTLSHSFSVSGTPYHAVISVEDANVTISGLTVDGQGKGDANSNFLGIGVLNSNATIGNASVTGIHNDIASFGDQEGFGIGVFNEDGTDRLVTVKNSSVSDFQKNGMAFKGGNLTVNVTNNTITGVGNTALIAQNGIELYGTSGVGNGQITGNVTNNTITDVSFADSYDYATSIYVINAANVTVKGNTVTGDGSSGFSYGLDVLGASNITVQNNTFSDLDRGISLYDSLYGPYFGGVSNVTVQGNTIENSGTGLYADPIEATALTIKSNTFTGNDIQFTGSSTDLPNVVSKNTFDKSVYVTGGGTIFSLIQDGVDAASSGDTVNVGKGTYEEQVSIGKNLTLKGAGIGKTIIDSPDTLATSFTAFSTVRKAILSVTGGANVSISGFTIDGLGKGGTNYSFEGIGIYDANATISAVDVTGIRDGGVGGTLDGIQAGVGIVDINDDGIARTVSLKNSSIEDFQKNATVFEGGDLTVTVSNNTITGAGSTGITAQNGIELYGISGTGNGIVKGTIQNNTITGISYAPVSNWSSTDILLIGADGTLVKGNTLTGEGTGDYSNGIYISGSNNVTVSNNTVSDFGWALDADTYYGNDTGLKVTGNTFENNYEAVYFDPAMSTPTVTGNTFTGNDIQLQGTPAEVTSALANNTFDATAVDTNVGDTIYGDLETAVTDANSGDTLAVNGTFVTSGQVEIDKDLTITGNASSRATITAGTDYVGDGEANAWILVDPNVTFSLSNVVIDGSGHTIYQGLRNEGNTTVDNVDFRNIMGSVSGEPYRGVAIESFGGLVSGGAGSDTNGSGGANATLLVENSTFEDIGREGILVKGTGSTADIIDNTYTGKGAGDWLDYGIEIGAGGSANITGNTITGALGVASADGSTSAGIMVTTYYGSGSSAVIENNNVTGNWVAVDVGYDTNDTSVVTAYDNNFSGNTHGVELESALATANFSGNWWGSTDASTIEASMTGADASLVDFSPFLMTGTDTDSGTAGFQGDFSDIEVTALGGGGTARIEEGVADVTSGGIVNVAAGNYTLAGELDIDKSLTLTGAGQGTTNITSNSTGYGIFVDANDVTLSNFTFYGPTAHTTSSYGIKVQPNPTDPNGVNARLTNFAISNVTINGGYRTGLDLNGVLGATIDHVTVENIVYGNGIALTDSANITLTNDTTTNNAWGGLALYQTNHYYNQQLNNISIDGSNTFNETNGVYEEDQSASLDMGSNVTIAGYSYADIDKSVANDQYTFFQKTQQGAIDFATNATLNGGHLSLANVYTEGWTGTALDNLFYVGTGANGLAMSIEPAVNAAQSGATVNVLAGNYTLAGELDIDKSLTLTGAGQGTTNITSNSTGYGIYVTGNDITLSDFTYYGPTSGTYGIKVEPGSIDPNARLTDFSISNVTIDGGHSTGLDLNGVLGATIDHVTVENIADGNGIALTDSANITLTNDTTTNNAWGGLALYQTNTYYNQQVNDITVDGTNTFSEANGIYAQDQSATNNFGTINLAGQGIQYIATVATGGSDGTYYFFQKNEQGAFDLAVATNARYGVTDGTVQGYAGTSVDGNNIFYVGFSGGTPLSIQAAVDAATAGGTINVLDGTYAEDVSDPKQLEFDFGDVTVDSLTLTSGSAGSSLNGDLTATGHIEADDDISLNGTFTSTGFSFDGITLTGNVTLDSSAANGDNTIASVTGGSHNLTVTEGNGDTSLGNVSGVGALKIDGTSTLTGTSYVAASEEFDGAVSLQNDVTLDTSAANGSITVASVTGNGNNLTIDAGTGNTSLGDVSSTDALKVDGKSTLTGTSYVADSEEFDGAVTLTGNTTLDTSAANGNITVASVTGAGNDLTIDAGTGNTSLGDVSGVDALDVVGKSTLTGTTYTADSETFGGAVTLANNVTLDTSASNGSISVASVTGAGHDLAIDAGTGNTSLGNVSGAGDLTVDGTATLTGTNYAAASEEFDGAVTLTGDTLLDTSGSNGDVAVATVTGGGNDLTISTGTGNTSLGDVSGVGALLVEGTSTLAGTSYVADSEEFDGAVTLTGDTTLDTSTANGDIIVASVTGNGHDLTLDAGTGNTTLGDVTGAGDVAVDGTATLNGALYTAASFDVGGAVTLAEDVVLDTSAANGNVTLASVTGNTHDLTIDTGTGTASLGDVTGAGGLAVSGAATLTGSLYTAASMDFAGAVTLTDGTVLDTSADNGAIVIASVDGTTAGSQSLTIDAGTGAVSLGNTGAATRLGTVLDESATTLTGTTYDANAFDFAGAVTLGNNVTIDTSAHNGAIVLASVDGTTAGGQSLTLDAGTGSVSLGNVGATTRVGAVTDDSTTTLTGTTYDANSLDFAGAVTLTKNATLDTSADNGAIVLASVNGASAGAQALTLNAGSGAVSLGNLGATTRLGAVTDDSDTTLTGSTYKANSFLFDGDVTLTAATTTVNTTQSASKAGDITFNGDIFGTANGGQNLTLIAGTGTGSASANGDITLQNAGTSSVRLNNMTVKGNNFTALTVWLANNFNATLTGSQAFAADTLHAGGDVTSNVGGNATGHIDATGNVVINAGDDISGVIDGNNVTLNGDDVDATVTAANAATVQANTIEGSYTGNTVSLTALDSVNANVTSATTFDLVSPTGSVDGTWASIDTTGSGSIDVNGQQTLGQDGINANQLVVEGFTLPAGTTIGANGQLILPQGMLLGLLAPGGGKPKMILVHSVQQLGQLLSEGYTVIVIDLKHRGNDNLQLASN